jgi:hypothetical protein
MSDKKKSKAPGAKTVCEKCNGRAINPTDTHSKCLKCLGGSHNMFTCPDCLVFPRQTKELRYKQQQVYICTGKWVGKEGLTSHTLKLVADGLLPPSFDKRKAHKKTPKPAESPAAHILGKAVQGASRSCPGATGQKGDVPPSQAGTGKSGRGSGKTTFAPAALQYMKEHRPILVQSVGAAAQVGAGLGRPSTYAGGKPIPQGKTLLAHAQGAYAMKQLQQAPKPKMKSKVVVAPKKVPPPRRG